jgi:hypothetical protein
MIIIWYHKYYLFYYRNLVKLEMLSFSKKKVRMTYNLGRREYVL